MKITNSLVILDLETTGVWVEKDKIVEIGMIKLLTGGLRQNYIKRVNPGIPIPVDVSRIIDITNADVKDAPPFRDIAAEVLKFIGNSDLAGFNIQRFDLPMLEREIIEAGLSFQWRNRNIYDAQKIYHIHEKRDLAAAYQLYCNKELRNVHSALGDAEATMEILNAQINRYGTEEEGIESLKDFEYERVNNYFDKERKFCWWNGKLYPMFGKYRKKYNLKEIVNRDRPYLEWILTQDFSNEVKMMIKAALDGQFPHPPGN